MAMGAKISKHHFSQHFLSDLYQTLRKYGSHGGIWAITFLGSLPKIKNVLAI